MDDAKIRERAKQAAFDCGQIGFPLGGIPLWMQKQYAARIEAALREAVAEERRAMRDWLNAQDEVMVSKYRALAALDAREQRQHTGRCMASPGECICGEQQDGPALRCDQEQPGLSAANLCVCGHSCGPHRESDPSCPVEGCGCSDARRPKHGVTCGDSRGAEQVCPACGKRWTTNHPCGDLGIEPVRAAREQEAAPKPEPGCLCDVGWRHCPVHQDDGREPEGESR